MLLLLLMLLKQAGRLVDVHDSWWRRRMFVCCFGVSVAVVVRGAAAL
jgi:hypothetical protein